MKHVNKTCPHFDGEMAGLRSFHLGHAKGRPNQIPAVMGTPFTAYRLETTAGVIICHAGLSKKNNFF